MLVLSNVFRANPQKHMGMPPPEQRTQKLITQSSLRQRQRTKTHDNINVAHEMDTETKLRNEKRLSNSVDTIIDTKSKVICSAKGLLETNLDDLIFNDSEDWSECKTKSLGASEPVLSFKDGTVTNRESLMSVDDSADDSATDSDLMDEVVQERSKCMGAKRFGHMLRRVISRNGKFNLSSKSFQ
ncbi:hypothetical protein NE865_09747 [Phthorimaea operculella]|nr:hypothetical protein NE865_09747 [Phthorimaea operculella]